jgi:hypothetical protein
LLLYLAHAHIQLGEGEKATTCYEHCLAVSPNNGYATSTLNFIHAVTEGVDGA